MRTHSVLWCGLAAALLLNASPCRAEVGGTLKKVADQGAITIGYREASIPFSYLDADGRPVGYTVDICRRVVAEVARELGRPDLKVRFQAMSPANRIPLLQNGTIDLGCGQDTHTVAREREVAFSTTIFVEEVQAAVRADSGIRHFEQLHGRTVSVNPGTTAVELLGDYQRRHHAGIQIQYGSDSGENFLLMSTGRTAANVGDNVAIAGQIANTRHPERYRFLPEVLRAEPYGIMLRRDDPRFKALVDRVVTGLIRSGEIETIYARWFESPIPPKGIDMRFPPTQAIRKAFAEPGDAGV